MNYIEFSKLSGYETSESTSGVGFGGTIAYDFAKKSRGISLETGLGFNYLTNMTLGTEPIESAQLLIYLKLLIK